MRRISSFGICSRWALLGLGALLTACASIGRPQGGPRDMDPPVFVRSNPAPGEKNIKTKRFDIYFDENVQLDDPSNKVIVSPAQKQMPVITSGGRRVTVELRDSLVPSTTYTIDFSDAINDLNEKNILDGFALEFSTGDRIDSLRVSGIVLDARTLEPAPGMLVGAYSNLADSAITTIPLERVSRTNQLGQFTLRSLKDADYNVFAVNDVNRDNMWDRSEDGAFYGIAVRPSMEDIQVTDTLRSWENQDSLVTRQGVRYLPNDILLTWFNEDYKAQYLKDYKRPERKIITLNFAAESDTLPVLTIVDGEHKGVNLADRSVVQRSLHRDSLVYWITDSSIIRRDTLTIATRYLRTDSLSNLSWTTDTLKFNFRERKSKENKKKKKDEEADSVPPITFINFSSRGSNAQDVHRPILFEASEPIARIDSGAVHLSVMKDTVWTAIPTPSLRADSINPMRFWFDYKWNPGDKYRIDIDSATVYGIYGEWNKPVKAEFKVRSLDEYGNIFFRITGSDQPMVVELLSSSDAVVDTASVVNGMATFSNLMPATYYARLFIDSNGNHKWDTGNMAAHLQPEEVYYYPKKITLKANWDVEQSWNIYELPLDMQKPYEIKKNKPKRKNGETDRNTDDEEEEDDFFNNGYQGTTNNRYDNDKRNLNNGNRGLRGMQGGLRQNRNF